MFLKNLFLIKINILRLAGFLFLFVFFCFSQDKTHTIYFDTDLSKVTNIEKNRLLSFIATLSEKNVSSVEIFGFCDDVGASSYNMSLSQERAEKIKKILLNNLIEERLITNVDGKGELLFRTTASTSPDRIRALNRKVELSVSFSKEVTLEKKTILTKGRKGLLARKNFSFFYCGCKQSNRSTVIVSKFRKISEVRNFI